MTDDPTFERNLRRYPWYAAFHNAFFWMPIFFLYFADHVTLGEVLALEAIYYAGVVAAEVPSGWFSDRYGRRLTLLISTGSLIAAYIGFAMADGFIALALAQVGLAAGIAFESGTGTALHYDSLQAAGREESYGEREGIVERNRLVASALAAALGGAAGAWDLRLVYLLSAAAAVVAFAIAWGFVEPEPESAETAEDFLPQLRSVGSDIRRPVLAWLFAYGVSMTVINHIPYEFYQPYIDLVGQQLDLTHGAPLATGLHMGVTTLLGAFAARRGLELEDWIGTGPTLLVATGLQTAIVAAMATILHPLLLVAILLRGLPRAIAAAPFRAAVTPRVSTERRATYLSVQSLVGRLGFAGVLGGLGLFAGTASPEKWSVLSELLGLSTGLAVVLLALLTLGLFTVDLSDSDDAPSDHE